MPADEILDPTILVREMVLTAPGVSEIAGGRVWGSEIPEYEASQMPRPCVVVITNGLGTAPPGQSDYVNVNVTRMEIRAYGQSPAEAARLSALVDTYLHQWRRRTVRGTLVWWATRISGPIAIRVAPGDWPATIRTYDVLHAT